MKLSEYAEHDAVGLAELVARGEVSPAELGATALEAVAAVDDRTCAVIETWEPVAPAAGPLAGVPFLVEDLALSCAGRLSGSGSRRAAGCRAGATEVLAQRFLDAGLVPVGRTATPEWARDTGTGSAAAGITRNPWDLDRTPGGSGGGSAAAVAAGIVPLAHATDAAGSIRIPAACSGLVGLTPSRGRAAQPGLSRTVRDTAALLDAVARPAGTGSHLAAAVSEPTHLRVGVLTEPWGGNRPTAAVAAAVRRAATLCAELGHEVVEARVDLGVSWEEFVRDSAAPWSGPDPARAWDTGARVTRSVAASMAELDLVLTPTLPDVAAPLGTTTTGIDGSGGHDRTARLFAYSPFTPWVSTAGLPAASLPLYQDEATGMPIGIQLVAAAGREDLVLALAGQLERAAPWSHRRPAVWAG
ncbi:amidase [Pseudonocardia ailaonensis]|uniref:Amidase n=1 Tax=Pseudonocardia ailaonensis TaxID=367279 RepID=A0ABN2MIN9_9PSEU